MSSIGTTYTASTPQPKKKKKVTKKASSTKMKSSKPPGPPGSKKPLGVVVAILVTAGLSFLFFDRGMVPQVSQKPKKKPASMLVLPKKPMPERVAVMRAIQALKPKVERCYSRLVRKYPGISGVVVVEFGMDWEKVEGYIYGTKAMEPAFIPEAFTTCLKKEALDLSFKLPKGLNRATKPKGVTFPFSFSKP